MMCSAPERIFGDVLVPVAVRRQHVEAHAPCLRQGTVGAGSRRGPVGPAGAAASSRRLGNTAYGRTAPASTTGLPSTLHPIPTLRTGVAASILMLALKPFAASAGRSPEAHGA